MDSIGQFSFLETIKTKKTMDNFNLTIDLMKFWGARTTTTKNGEEVIVTDSNVETENSQKETDENDTDE